MKKILALLLALIFALSFCACGKQPAPAETASAPAAPAEEAPAEAAQEEVINLTIDSWRTDDIAAWQDIVIPAYEATHPNVKLTFNAINNSEYTTVLTTRLQGGAAGDIIMCEPYDSRISLFKEGYLADLSNANGLEHFEDFALSAWSTDEGELYAIPLAAVTHGFMYNKTVFDQLGLTAPETVEEFFAVCEAIKAAGYAPISMGAAEEWVSNVYGYSIVCPTFTKGEEGRQGLINGTASFTDEGFVDSFKFIENWIPYLPDGYQAITCSDMYTLFATQQCLIMPCGSWDITNMMNMINGDFEIGAFQTPDAGFGKFVCFHPDNALSLNSASPNKEAALEFIEWITTEEFAKVWNSALPGFFTLTDYSVSLENALANEMLSWASTADGAAPRVAYQYISRDFNTDNEISRVTTLMLLGEMNAEEAAQTLQDGFASGYTPAK